MGHHHPHTVKMVSNLWKRVKSSAIEEDHSCTQSNDMNLNATVCRREVGEEVH